MSDSNTAQCDGEVGPAAAEFPGTGAGEMFSHRFGLARVRREAFDGVDALSAAPKRSAPSLRRRRITISHFIVFSDPGFFAARTMVYNSATQEWEYSVVANDFAAGRYWAMVAVTFAGPVGPIYSTEVIFDVVAAD